MVLVGDEKVYKKVVNTFKLVSDLMEKNLSEGSIALDCTVGNGNDTLALAKLVGKTGRVYGFDIQKIAIENTKERLACENPHNNVKLILDTNENIDKYISEKLDFIIYNLGYLPRGDKNIITREDTTINSLKKSLDLLNNNGLILITSYTGHRGGLEEKEAVERLLSSLNQKEYNVLKYNFINQKNNPPILYGIEKSN